MSSSMQAAWETTLSGPQIQARIAARKALPPQEGKLLPLPAGITDSLRKRLAEAGITQLYSHQIEAFDRAQDGSFIVTSATASGKSLCFNLPVSNLLAQNSNARALYLYPTKALAQDQARALLQLQLPQLQPAIYDGDTDSKQRPWIRKSANIVLSNPDMLHVGLLPHHERWAQLLSQLHYVVIDEAHVYRGVFGSHVANVLRRLRRLAQTYGSDPKFLLTSATLHNPLQLAQNLTGIEQIKLIDRDGAPQPGREIVLWNPPLIDSEAGVRVSALSESARLVADLTRAGVRSICFIKSRRGVELITRMAKQLLHATSPELVERIAPYRGGYTVQQRQQIQQRLSSGDLLAVVATNALELGIDIGQLECSICTTFPGTVASLKQMWGRAGRVNRGLSVFIAGDDALDQFFCRHPEQLLERQSESVILNPANQQIRSQHLLCAAYETPLSGSDQSFFGEELEQQLEPLVDSQQLRRSGDSYSLRSSERYIAGDVTLRSSESGSVTIVLQSSGEIIGELEPSRALSTLHQGAIYIHLGESYRVLQLDLERRTAVVTEHSEDYYTQTKRETDIWIERAHAHRKFAGFSLYFGEIELTEHVVAYKRKRLSDHSVIDYQSLDLPPQRYLTEALWYVPEPQLLERAIQPQQLLGALHAAEHTQISVLPLIAMCDRWDIGGLSTNFHVQTEQPSVFIYDGFPGGIGITRCGFERFDQLLKDAIRVLVECACSDGCPSCVQSPKCGNLNEPLDKAGALSLLTALQDLPQGLANDP